MYGMDSILPLTGAALMTGGIAFISLNISVWVLTILGLTLIGIALVELFRPDGKTRP